MKLVLCIGYSQSLRCTQGLQKQTALLTVRGKEQAFLSRSLGSFFIGVVSRAPAMEKLCFQPWFCRRALGKRAWKAQQDPSAWSSFTLQDELTAGAWENSFDSRAWQHSFDRREQLTAARACSSLRFRTCNSGSELTAEGAYSSLCSGSASVLRSIRAWEASFAHWACWATNLPARKLDESSMSL